MFEPLNITFRVVLAIIFLFAVTKFLTKRSLSNLTYFDYIAMTILGTIGGNLAFNIKIHILNFILSMTLVTLIIMLVSCISLKWKRLRKFFAGEPTVLIKNGEIVEDSLSSLNYSYDYLNQQLRQETVFDMNQVELAILEPSGKLSIKLKPQNQPSTSVHNQYEGFATEIILDGKIIKKSIEKKGLSQEWLYKELNKRGIENIKKVAFAAIATNGKLYVDADYD